MSGQLFRAAAIERLSTPERLDEQFRVTTCMDGIALAALLALAVVGLTAALLVRVPQLVHGTGILLLPAGMLDVSVETGGRIQAVYVEVGQSLRAGQVVARLDQPELESALAQAQAEAADAATARMMTANAQAQARQMRERIAQAKREGLRRALVLANERLAAFTERLALLSNLAKSSFVLRQTLVDAKIRIGDSEQEVAETQRALTQVDADLANAAIADAQALLALDLRAGESARREAAARQRVVNAEAVVSPYKGRVVELKHDSGELVEGGAPFASLGLFAVFLCIALVSGWLEARILVGQEEAAAIAADRSLQLVQCVDHLRSAGAEDRAFAHWGIAMLRAGAASLRAGQIGSRFRGFAAAFELLGLILFFGVLNAGHTAGATTGDLATMIAAFAGFSASASGFCLGLRRVMLLKPKGVRAMGLVRAAPESGPDRRPPGTISGRIEINNLSFAYGFQPAPHERAGTPVLDRISLRIEPGEFIALVGASGCGKSTLVRLLLGFERPQRGGVFYDRQNLKDLDLRALRRQIGVMLQAGHFMPGSIAENILGATGGRLEDAWEAARLAGLAEDIEQMPMGMHTILTDGASGLSGGQTQRLLIARALASKPRILILDEATSALDNLTQAVVTENLERMKLTRIVVAHRLSTIIKADRIYVLAGGHIVQSGSYQDLMAQPGVFAHLARRQDP